MKKMAMSRVLSTMMVRIAILAGTLLLGLVRNAVAEDRILLVGVGDPLGQAPLPGVANDIATMRRAFTSLGFPAGTMQTLIGKNATRRSFQTSVRSWLGGAGPSDLAVLYFTGHGGQMRDDNGDELDGLDETILLFDGAVRDDNVATAIGSLGARAVLVIIDACAGSGVTRQPKAGEKFAPKDSDSLDIARKNPPQNLRDIIHQTLMEWGEIAGSRGAVDLVTAVKDGEVALDGKFTPALELAMGQARKSASNPDSSLIYEKLQGTSAFSDAQHPQFRGGRRGVPWARDNRPEWWNFVPARVPSGPTPSQAFQVTWEIANSTSGRLAMKLFNQTDGSSTPPHGIDAGSTATLAIGCQRGDRVCFGGGARGGGSTAGVGIEGNAPCADCCVPCDDNKLMTTTLR